MLKWCKTSIPAHRCFAVATVTTVPIPPQPQFYKSIFTSVRLTCKRPAVHCLHPHSPSLLALPLPSSPSACNLNSVAQWTNRSQGVLLFFIPAIFL